MNFNSYIDKVYVINLLSRKDRLLSVNNELLKQNINNYTVYPAIPSKNMGILMTQIKLITEAFYNGYNSILILEDDVKSVNDLVTWYESVKDFDFIKKYQYDILYLGCNAHGIDENRQPFALHESIVLQNKILKVKDVYGCHAMIFTYSGMYKFLQMVNQFIKANAGFYINEYEQKFSFTTHYYADIPNDVYIQRKLLPVCRAYASYPMIFSQQNGYSDIEKREMNQEYIEQRFKQQTEKLFKQK